MTELKDEDKLELSEDDFREADGLVDTESIFYLKIDLTKEGRNQLIQAVNEHPKLEEKLEKWIKEYAREQEKSTKLEFENQKLKEIADRIKNLSREKLGELINRSTDNTYGEYSLDENQLLAWLKLEILGEK